MMLFRKPVSTELLPCPFCGGRAVLSETFGKLVASCNADGCIKPSTWLSSPDTTDLRDVARVWNARPKRKLVPEPEPEVAAPLPSPPVREGG